MQTDTTSSNPITHRNLVFAMPKTETEKQNVQQEVERLFTVQRKSKKRWTDEQIDKGDVVRSALIKAYCTILENVPASATRTRALNCLLDSRLLANAAITFDGEY